MMSPETIMQNTNKTIIDTPKTSLSNQGYAIYKNKITEKDLENTSYKFTLDDGQEVEVKGNEEIEYDGEIHSAANLYDALKEGYYGKF